MGLRGKQAGRQASEIAVSDRITTSLREKEKMISVTCSASYIHPSDHRNFIFSSASSVYMRLWACVLMSVEVLLCFEGNAATQDVNMHVFM